MVSECVLGKDGKRKATLLDHPSPHKCQALKTTVCHVRGIQRVGREQARQFWGDTCPANTLFPISHQETENLHFIYCLFLAHSNTAGW